jgi:hypothetical protein
LTFIRIKITLLDVEPLRERDDVVDLLLVTEYLTTDEVRKPQHSERATVVPPVERRGVQSGGVESDDVRNLELMIAAVGIFYLEGQRGRRRKAGAEAGAAEALKRKRGRPRKTTG